MRCRKCCTIVLLAAVLVMLVCSPLLARSIPGASNEVDDPWFEGLGVGWYVEVIQGTPVYTENDTFGNLPGNYLDPGRNPGDSVFIRTIVDDYEGLWDPDLSKKEIDLSLFAHVAGDGYVNVRFDWWDDENIPRPSNDPNDHNPADPNNPPPDGWSQWYVINGDGSHSPEFQNIATNVGEEGGFMDADLWQIRQIWDHQPRWVSIEIEAGIAVGEQVGGEALITGIDFEAQCVPEPSTFVLLCMGAFGLLLNVRRGRK